MTALDMNCDVLTAKSSPSKESSRLDVQHSMSRENDPSERNPVPHDNYFQSYISLHQCFEAYLHSRSHDRAVSIPQRSDMIHHIALIIAGGTCLYSGGKSRVQQNTPTLK